MDDLFERFFSDWEQDIAPWGRRTDTFSFPLESYVDGNTFIIKADLPGVDPNAVEVVVEGNLLTIKAERKAAQEHDGNNYYYQEVRYGSYQRTLTLPEGVTADDVHARYANGVLEISLPAPAAMAMKKIPIAIESTEQKQIAA
jgi:HSP20 family protein